MRSQDTNLSSMESHRYASRPMPLSASSSNPTTTAAAALPTVTTATTNNSATASSNKAVEPTDTILSTTPNDVYQHVYHDDSSTHGSRTLDSRFSREKDDSSDDQQTDDDDDEDQATHACRSSEPFEVEIDRRTRLSRPFRLEIQLSLFFFFQLPNSSVDRSVAS